MDQTTKSHYRDQLIDMMDDFAADMGLFWNGESEDYEPIAEVDCE